jgi:hypothetical protein
MLQAAKIAICCAVKVKAHNCMEKVNQFIEDICICRSFARLKKIWRFLFLSAVTVN